MVTMQSEVRSTVLFRKFRLEEDEVGVSSAHCADGSEIQECNSSVNLRTMCSFELLYLQPLIQLRLFDTTHCFFELFLVTFESLAVALETEKSLQGIGSYLVGCIELMVSW